jgi:hypothetical protein
MKQTILPSRDSSNVTQLSALLATTQALQPYLILPPQELGTNPPPALDGGTVAAAATTFIKVCAKIDELLEDKSRWNLETQDAFYDAVIQTQEQQQKFLKTQTAAAASVMRPSYQFRPTLFLTDGGYIAVHGDLTSSGVVIGSGPTPEAALLDFDAAWQRRPDEQKVLVPVEETTPPIEENSKKRRMKKA